MKRTGTALLTTLTVVAVFAGSVWAAEHGPGMHQRHNMHGKREMAGKKAMKRDMSKMQDRMMGGMMKRQVVATEDGGVIIVAGNLLLKYDENLELVKKTSIDISAEDMQQMKNDCRGMCRQMMMGQKKSETPSEP